MIRLAIVLFLAVVASGCTSADTRTTSSVNPAFGCATAEYARNHVEDCAAFVH